MALVGDVYADAVKLAERLREDDVYVAVDSSGRKLDKQLKTAVKKGIRYVIIVGESELAESRFTLRDLVKSTEETHSIDRIISLVKDHRAVE